MKIINLNSGYDLSPAQLHFTQTIICADHDPQGEMRHLANEVPIFLLHPDSMPGPGATDTRCPSTEWLGFYAHRSPILGVQTPVIGICPERIAQCAKNEEELVVLTAKVIVHELAHAVMRLHPAAIYQPVDAFYYWMEEPMANLITLEYFSRAEDHFHHERRPYAQTIPTRKALDYVMDFIDGQPDNYRLALDLYSHRVRYWWIWRNQKENIQKRAKEKQDWLNYVQKNVGHIDGAMLSQLFEALHR